MFQSVQYKCEGRVHAIKRESLSGGELLEVRCIDKRCANRRIGEVVFHYFDLETGELSHTKKYREPVKNNGYRAVTEARLERKS